MEPELKRHKKYEHFNLDEFKKPFNCIIISETINQNYIDTYLLNDKYITTIDPNINNNTLNNIIDLSNREPQTIYIRNYFNFFNYKKHDIILANLMFNSRSFKTSFIIHQNTPEIIHPEFRSNFDYVIIGKVNNTMNLNRIYRWYCGFVPTYEEFLDIYNNTVNDNTFLLIDCYNTINTIKILSHIF